MLSSKSKCRIVGVTLGEAHLNFIKPDVPPLTAEFGLVRDDEALAGMVQKRFEWSEKTMAAVAALQEAMEGDMLEAIFDPQPESDYPGEPQQV